MIRALLSPNMSEVYRHKVYLILTKPKDSISSHVIRRLAAINDTLRIYVACPSSHQQQAERIIPAIDEKCVLLSYNRLGTKEQVESNATTLIEAIQEDHIDGMMINFSGISSDFQQPTEATGLLEMAETKLVGENMLVQKLLRKGLLHGSSRIIYSSTEAARGLPKMGFPIPTFADKTLECILSYMDGSGYAQPLQWEHSYSYIHCIQVLYMMAFAKKHPQLYLCSISPGMTQESFSIENHAVKSWSNQIQLWIYYYLLFPWLKYAEIAKESTEAAEMFFLALTANSEWQYMSGTFVAAQVGTAGPICDQTETPNGAMFLDDELQELAYQAIQKYL